MYRPAPNTERPPCVQIMRRIGLEPDPWQIEVLESERPQMLLNCCRQAGKSTVVAILALVEAMYKPMTRVILLSRSHRQSRELLKTIAFFFDMLRQPLKKRLNAQEIELDNWSRIVSLPCREDTIRGYSQVDLMVIDEAARVPDDLYRAVRPMLAITPGRLICLSTPYGKRGFFWDEWVRGGDDWGRIEIPASKCPRISEAFLARERRSMGESWFRQEYCCSFESLEGLVYPDFTKCVVPEPAPAFPKGAGKWVGGIDFGFRNPFAAVWGFLDRDDILWLTGEQYGRFKPLSDHAAKLPKNVMWYADPAGANERAELRVAGFVVNKGNNSVRSGIAMVSARLHHDALRIVDGRCPNLVAEAGLYRYGEGEMLLDEHNHALDALRYLISRIDVGRLIRRGAAPSPKTPTEAAPKEDPRMFDDPDGTGFWIPSF